MTRAGIRIGLLLAASILIASCATRGQVFDSERSNTFVIGQTTPEEAVAALGEPSFDYLRPDGLRIVRWEYQRLRGLAITRHVIGANFGADGRLTYLHNPKRPEVVDPF